ncbi:MAG TPA: glucans biosynthesis glucosyltransferase MdoH [Steroidobacteraceae bacterium]|jgi:membrane glycosyltransferase|nr:glucans biosynthesis glucosyltransferase MdoH [Steroidobacteraceae bacterium]
MTSLQSAQRDRRLHPLWRRTLFFGLTLLTALAGGQLMLDVLRANGLSGLEVAGLVMFMVLFTWIAGAFWTAVAGFLIRLIGRDPAVLSAAQLPSAPLRSRTAIVAPIYNEDTARVFAGIEAIWSSLMQQREQGCFDFFVLSDTRQSEIAQAEERAWRALVARLGADGRLFYRRRSDNLGRKSGNIAEFVRNWGGAYDYMIVLDADSIMSGQALVSLASLMDAHPNVGIIQTLPLLMGRETLFARLLQFAVRLNGPMFASGLAFWQLGEGNYWGHNAIVRLQPFAEHCALPRLPGAAPFGGEILSHDIVEAAFMRRAGYKIWLVPDISGSWEEIPSNVIDFAARDRRWAQGNLQHVGVMPLRGLHWLSRVHMLTGILSYATSPMWLAVLVLSSIVTCLTALTKHQYFQHGTHTLFPSWPQYRDGEIFALLATTITLLMLPKLLGALLTLKDRRQRAGFGGALRLCGSVLFEQTLSMLLAPTMMLFHSSFVVRTLLGREVRWDAQARGDRGIRWREAFARHKWHAGLGLVWGAAILVLAPHFIWWMLPVIAGMLIAVPFTVLTSRADIGRALRRWGLLLTPEETAAPPELAALFHHVPLPGAAENQPTPVAMPQRLPLPMAARAPVYMWGLRQRSRALPAVAGYRETVAAASPALGLPSTTTANPPSQR